MPRPMAAGSARGLTSELDDLTTMAAAFASPEGPAVMADAANFLDMSRPQLLVVEDVVPLPAGNCRDRSAKWCSIGNRRSHLDVCSG